MCVPCAAWGAAATLCPPSMGSCPLHGCSVISAQEIFFQTGLLGSCDPTHVPPGNWYIYRVYHTTFKMEDISLVTPVTEQVLDVCPQIMVKVTNSYFDLYRRHVLGPTDLSSNPSSSIYCWRILCEFLDLRLPPLTQYKMNLIRVPSSQGQNWYQQLLLQSSHLLWLQAFACWEATLLTWTVNLVPPYPRVGLSCRLAFLYCNLWSQKEDRS